MLQDVARKHRPPNIGTHPSCTTKRHTEQKKDNETTSSSTRAVYKKCSSINTPKSVEKQAKRTKMTNDQLPEDHRRLTKQQQ
eukprot:13382700-Ditylum_brightwellii.AAC.1